jgi:arylsulfatase A-like enzyme
VSTVQNSKIPSAYCRLGPPSLPCTDLCWSLGVAGDLPVETPFIDWLARNKAMRFTHNCVTSSICWISRATLHSGQYFSRHKAEEPASEQWYENFHESFPALLKNAGYFLGHVGKWHTWNSHKISRKCGVLCCVVGR